MESITYVRMYVPALFESLSALNLKVWHFKKIITSEIKSTTNMQTALIPCAAVTYWR